MGSLVCEGVGPIFLGAKLVTFKKNRSGKRRKKKTKRREKRRKTYLPRFNQQVDPTLSVVRSSWKLEKKFKTWVATIWMVKIRFWAWELVLLHVNSNNVFGYTFSNFLCFFSQERLYNLRLYVFLMYLAASKDYFRKDKCNALLLILEVWTGLGLVVFPFAFRGFPSKNYGV